MTKLQFIPSENLDQYTDFVVTSPKNKFRVQARDYNSALLTFQALIKTLEIKDDINLEGFNQLNKEKHTIWYSHNRKQKPFMFFYET